MRTRGFRQAAYAPAATAGRVFADELAGLVRHLGVRDCFGVGGDSIAPVVDALGRAELNQFHCRNEGGAMFAAAEASLAAQRPCLVFTNTGPGLTNALTGVLTARDEGAQVILVSAATPVHRRGAFPAQETHHLELGRDLFEPGPLFDFAGSVERPGAFGELAHQLASGLARPHGYVAHVSVPLDVQTMPSIAPRPLPGRPLTRWNCSRASMAECVRVLGGDHSAVLWIGYGARHAAAEVLELAHRTGVAVMCSARAKGIYPEDSDQFLGVTGRGGHRRVTDYFERNRPDYVIVLGSRLGETTSGWRAELVPGKAFIHVDMDPSVFGRAYPYADTFGIPCEIGIFLDSLLAQLPGDIKRRTPEVTRPFPPPLDEPVSGAVRPQVLMDHLQRLVVRPGAATIMAEPGSARRWCDHWLRIPEPGRYRTTAGFAAAGSMAAGAAGAAAATGRKTLAVVTDLHPELVSAVHWNAPAIWLVLNEAEKPARIDYAQLARAVGAAALTVETECHLSEALTTALNSPTPFVLDVLVRRS